MKELTREIIKTEIYGYAAVDGAFFESREECFMHENKIKPDIMKEFEKLVIAEITEIDLFDTGNEDYGWKIVIPQNAKECKTIQQAIGVGSYASSTIDDDCIGKQLMCFCEFGTNEIWNAKTIDEVLEDVKHKYEQYMANTKNRN